MKKVELPKPRISSVLVGLLIIWISPIGIADNSKPNIGDVLEKLKTYYASINDYEATFIQTTAHKMFAGRLQRAYGTVKFKKGGRMRWEYSRPEKRLFIYDGKKLWVYEPEVPQVFSGAADTDRLRKALAFLTGEGNLKDEYKARLLSAKKHGFPEGIVVGLWPKNAKSPFKRVEMYLDSKTFRVRRSVVVDHEGNRIRFDFDTPKTNTGLLDAIFAFTPPPGVQILEAPK